MSDTQTILSAIGILLVPFLLGCLVPLFFSFRKARRLGTLSTRIKKAEADGKELLAKLDKLRQTVADNDDRITEQQKILAGIRAETAELRQMKEDTDRIRKEYAEIAEQREILADLQAKLDLAKNEVSLYSEAQQYIELGLYPLPGYETASSGAFAEMLKDNRSAQKNMLKDSAAFTCPPDIEITGNKDYDRRAAKAQGQLLVRAFNAECDYLIAKINGQNYEATLSRIEQLAEKLEKMLITLEIGLSLPYVELKMKEATLYYQYQHKKAAEQEEQREIRAQMREEAAAQREIEKALRDAEREEALLQQAMQRVRQEMAAAGEAQRMQYETQLATLEARLIEAEARGQRALSMAQQTKRGHVYIISNIGSFGEDVFKIGMTRRLEPTDRIAELGDASVPFPFDIHAMIFSDDAPALEYELHQRFAAASVNKINPRKEFFAVSLTEIKDYLEQKGLDVRWTMTADAAQYRQSLQLSENETGAYPPVNHK